jgi:hypothetical protein
MHLQTVTSSNLDQVGYDAARLQLIVVFKSGAAYRYDGVPSDCYERLLQADSKGKFFMAHVRNAFPFTRLDARTFGQGVRHASLVQVEWRSLEFEPAFF